LRLKKCGNCTFIKFYFLVIVTVAVTLRFYPDYTGLVSTVLMVGIPVLLLRKSTEELGFRNFLSGLKWGLGSSAVILPIYALICSQITGIRELERGELFNLVAFYLSVAISEEVFFRGYLYSEVENEPFLPFISKANFVSSFLFGVAHALIYYDPTMFKVFFPSLVMGWLFERSKSLGAPILFHFLSDLTHSLVPC